MGERDDVARDAFGSSSYAKCPASGCSTNRAERIERASVRCGTMPTDPALFAVPERRANPTRSRAR